MNAMQMQTQHVGRVGRNGYPDRTVLPLPTLSASGDASEDEAQAESQRQHLIALCLVAYAFTRDEIRRLTLLLAEAQLAAQERAVGRARETVGASTSWSPTSAQQQDAHEQARQAAEGIAATFLLLLHGYLTRERFLTTSEAQAGIAAWAHTLVTWKVPQVVNVTLGAGQERGTDLVVTELLDGDLEDEDGAVIGAAGYQFQVIPDESSNDFCRDYAGQTFDLSEWEEVPAFPAHPSCRHSRVLVPISS